ncbi:MAG: YdjY domain-containing protein [Phycisphaerae bacterium]|nr:YdjY domain-containing protein [Phycisphaerae bacterium]
MDSLKHRRVALFSALVVTCAVASLTRAQAPTTAPAGRAVRYADGITLNWPKRQVEIDATVVLREGFLELLACSPDTKEHESILRVAARPQRIYEAVGLLGVPDGRPPQYDEKSQRVTTPRGTPIDVLVRYRRDGKDSTHDAREWLIQASDRNPVANVRWYWVASAAPPNERFGADIYGTVVALVQFGSSMVLLAPNGSIHPPQREPAATSRRAIDDTQYANTPEDLVLLPNPKSVPPEGTTVTLILRPARTGHRLRVDRFGTFEWSGHACDVAELTAGLREVARDGASARVDVSVAPGTLEQDIQTLQDAFSRAGLALPDVAAARSPEAGFPEHDAAAAAELLLHQLALHQSLWQDVTTEWARLGREIESRRESLQQGLDRIEGLLVPAARESSK